MHKLLVNRLLKPAQEKSVTDRPAMTIAVDMGRKATKQTNHGGVGSSYELIQKIKMENSIRHVWVNIKCENELFSGRSFMKHYMYHFCYEYNMIYLYYVQIIIVCASLGSVIEHYSNQSSGCVESRDNRP